MNMNIQQATTIYARVVFETAADQLAELIHDDFKTHGQGIAWLDDNTVNNAIRAIQAEVGATVDQYTLREAVQALHDDAWARVEAPETDAS